MKRGLVTLDGGFRFRFSRAGFDVDTAAPAQMAIDERYFYGQLFLAGFMGNSQPAAGHAEVVTFPSLGFTPLCLCYSQYDGKIVYPAPDKYKTGGGTFFYPSISYEASPSSLTLFFGESSGVTGIYYLIFRRRA